MNNKIVDCLIKENGNFYLDLDKWDMISDIKININDNFNFIYENKKYFVKVFDIINDEAILEII